MTTMKRSTKLKAIEEVAGCLLYTSVVRFGRGARYRHSVLGRGEVVIGRGLSDRRKSSGGQPALFLKRRISSRGFRRMAPSPQRLEPVDGRIQEQLTGWTSLFSVSRTGSVAVRLTGR